MLDNRFDRALVYASRLHAGQTRNDTAIPYISHPLAVCALVLEAGGNEDQTIAALLHDAAEDHGGRARLDDIARKFGEQVAAIVEACSDSLEEPKPPWRARKDQYLEHLRQAPDEALLVSLADKLHNARSVMADYERLGDSVFARFQGGRDYVRWYERELARIFSTRLPGPLAMELQRIVATLIDRIGQPT